MSLWDPIRLGELELRNRCVMPAMGTGYASREGHVTDRLRAYHRRRAEGGVGLIITEVAAIHPTAKGFLSELVAYDDSFLPGLESLAAAIKSGGASAALQLHHAGRETLELIIGEQPVAPSALAGRTLGQTPRALSREEIHEIVACFGAAAKRAKEVGFDAVEVHGAHGYLVNQFLSPYTNIREDEYGGDAMGRFRFAREVVRAIKEETGRDFPVIFRLSSTEEVQGGYDLAYILPLLPLLEEDGVDAFHVSCGVYDSPGSPTCPGIHFPPGINVERAARVKETVGVPVIVVGKLHDPRLAERVLDDGKADMVAFGRQHLADPMFLTKAQAGRYEDIRFCLSCNQGCIERISFEMKSATCVINPECGEEWKEKKSPAKAGPFLVIGAGPGGLQAAITLAEAGAEARVLERDHSPGGQLQAASRPPGKEPFWDWVEWAVRRLTSLGIRIEFEAEANDAILEEGNWAGIVVATGSKPVLPTIPGSELGLNVEAREVLLGRRETGERVLIVGAGSVGMETADYLIEKGCRVVVVEERNASPVLPMTSHGYFLHKRLRENGELLLGSTVLEVTEQGAVISSLGERVEIQADTVVWAVGSRPEKDLTEAAARAGLETQAVGDAVEPRRLIEAVHEGARAAEGLLFEEKERSSLGG